MPFGNLGTIWSEIGLNTQKLDQGLMAAQLKLANADKSISSFGQKLTASSTKLMVAGGLMAGSVLAVGVAAVKMASQFETSMRNVNSISKLSETEFKALGQSVIGISKKFPQTAKELADGLYDIASSGFSGAAGLKVLEASASAASAGLTTTATSAKGITAVLNAYGLEADKAAGISDTMFRTVDKGVITFEELSSTVGDWVGMSKAAGISFNEASGAIAYMTTKGISASEAGVSLQRMLTGIIKPTDEMAAVIKNAGFESGEMMLKTLGLTGTMDVLNKATGGSITKLIELIPEIRGVRGANALLGAGYEDLTKFMGDFNDTTGATAIALAEQSKSLEFQLNILKNNATALGIELGNKLIPALAKTVKGLNELSPETKDNIYNFAEMTLKVIGSGGAILLLAGAFGKLRMIMLANPIMAAVAGFVALNGAVDLGSGKLEELNTVWGTLGATALKMLTPMVAVKDGLSSTITIYKALADGIITLDDMQNLNIVTEGKLIEKINELREAKEKDKTATEEEITAAATSGDINAIAALKIKMREEAHWKVVAAANADTGATEAVTFATATTKEEVDALTTKLDALNGALESGAISPLEYIEQLKILGTTVENVAGGFERIVNAAFRLFNANAASEQSIKSVDEALKEYEKALNATTGSHVANSAAAQAWLAGNVDYQIALAKSGELQAKITKLQAEGKEGTSTYLTAVKNLGTQQEKINQLTNEAAKATNSYTSSGKQSAAQIEETRIKAEALAASIQKGLIDWQFEYQQLTTSLTPLTEEQVAQMKELQGEYVNAGLEAVKLKIANGESAESAIGDFVAMASGFGMSATQIIKYADDTNIKLDFMTRQRIISVETGRSISAVNLLEEALNRLHDKDIAINFTGNWRSAGIDLTHFMGAMGGIVTVAGIQHFALGGTVGIPDIPHAASGMTIPQTGRAVPIIAHEYEDIINTSQQRNLAEWIMDKANSRPEKGNSISSQEVILHIPLSVDGKVLYEVWEKYDIQKEGERVK